MATRNSFSRQLLGALLALAVAASSAEALSGELRDGGVHHENAANATAHHDVQGAHGDHGHEDASAPGTHEHGPEHEHGTSADHCTHVHGQALVMPDGVALDTVTVEWGFVEPRFHIAFVTGTLTYPPKV